MTKLLKISKRTVYILASALVVVIFSIFLKLVSPPYTLFITAVAVISFLAIVLNTIKRGGRFVLSLIALFLLLLVLIQVSFVQNWMAGIATRKLSKGLGTEVRIKSVGFSLFDKVNLEGVLIRDKQKDTILYAGQLRVRITDWFFVKEKADLKFIGLEDAVIKLQRTDSVWNYQFIVNYLAKPKAVKDTSKGMEINLKKVDLKNVTFVQNDLWHGEKITASVSSLLLDAEDLKLSHKVFHINSLQIEKPYVRIDDFQELMPDSLKPKPSLKIKDTTLRFNLGLSFTVNNFGINNGTFINESGNEKPAVNSFDGNHLQLTQLKGTFKDFSFVDDTLKAIIDISAKERCGFDLKKLKTNLKVTPQIIELAKLDLQTNRSRLGNYYSMKFDHFKKDFKNYTTDVLMDAKFRNSKINSDDIAFFVPDLKTWKKEVAISGNFLGTVADFHIKNLFLHSGSTTDIAGDLAMKGLPDIDKTIIHFNQGYIKTNHTDLGIVIPALRRMNNPNLASLGNVLFRGNFNGTTTNFKTTGVISTNIGAVDANVAMTFPKKGEPTYDGTLITTRFNLGKFINTKALGLVTFKGKVKGSSFDLTKMKSSIDGNFSLLEFNNYSFTNIITTGTFLKQYFNGELKIDDPNLDFTSTVEIDMSKKKPSFNILGDLVKADLQKIHLTKDKYDLTGLFDLNFKGSNIDEFEGTAKILNANLVHDKNRLSFDSLVVRAEQTDSNRILTATSNEFLVTVTGKQYKLLDLPIAFQTYLNHYYPTYFNAPATALKDQDFSITLATKEFDKYAKLIDTNISGLNYASLTGSINTSQNQFTLLASVPDMSYGKYHIRDAFIKGEGTLDTLRLNAEVANIRIGDSLNFPNSTASIQSSNDHSAISIKTKAENTLNEANLNADLYTLEDGVRINFRPSEFVLNDKRWNLEKQGEIVIRKNFVSAENVKFSQGFQEIKVETELSEDASNRNDLVISLKNVVLGDITSLVTQNPRMEGIGNGKIRLNDFYGQFNAEADIKAEQFRVDNDSIGLVNLKGSYDSRTGKIPFSIQSPNEGYKFSSEGVYNLKDTSNKALYINTHLENSGIGIAQRFIGDIFNDLTGKATGNLIVNGNPDALNLSGKIKLIKSGLTVNFTQVHYDIDSATIAFNPDGIDFGRFKIQDKFKNTGTVGGKLYEKNFKNMSFDFNLTTDKLLLIDTKSKDNKQFYGKAIGKAALSFKGPETAARMSILAEANDSSNIAIKTSAGKESGAADFIVFKQYGTELTEEKKKSNFDLTVDLDVSTNRMVDISVILDELSGDVIKAKGTGRLKIVAGSTAPLSIKGRYNIDVGEYNFNFQSFIRRPFEMLDADNYIEWNGDPYNATIRIDAQYTADHVSVGDLISNQQVSGISNSTRSYRGEVYVVAHLRDKLTKPNIAFSLDFPQKSPVKTDAVFSEFVTRIETDQNEMLSQATSLIVFGTFAPYGKGFLGEGNNTAINMLGVNTISQLLTMQVNKAVTNFLYKLTKDKSIVFDINASAYSSSSILDQNSGIAANNTGRLDRSTVNFKFGKSFFNDKLVVSFGGDFDFNVGNSSSIANGNFQWLPDFNAEYILSRDNTNKQRLSFILFSKNSLDINTAGSALGRRSRQGASISYKRDFEKLIGSGNDDLIKIKPKKDTLPKANN